MSLRRRQCSFICSGYHENHLQATTDRESISRTTSPTLQNRNPPAVPGYEGRTTLQVYSTAAAVIHTFACMAVLVKSFSDAIFWRIFVIDILNISKKYIYKLFKWKILMRTITFLFTIDIFPAKRFKKKTKRPMSGRLFAMLFNTKCYK